LIPEIRRAIKVEELSDRTDQSLYRDENQPSVKDKICNGWYPEYYFRLFGFDFSRYIVRRYFLQKIDCVYAIILGQIIAAINVFIFLTLSACRESFSRWTVNSKGWHLIMGGFDERI